MNTDNRKPQTDWQDEALDQLLADAKVQFDEAWMKEAESHIPSGMDERLLHTLARLEKEENETLSLDSKPLSVNAEPTLQPPRRTLMRRWYELAACSLLLLTLGIGWGLSELGEPTFTDTCATPEEAQLQLERALVTLNMNGKRAVKQARKTMRETSAVQQPSKYISFSTEE